MQMTESIEEQLLSYLKGKYSSIYLTYNEHSSSFIEAEEAIKYCYDHGSWVSQSEKDRAIKENRVWCLQIYPNTPNGCYCILGASLEAVLKAAKEGIKND